MPKPGREETEEQVQTQAETGHAALAASEEQLTDGEAQKPEDSGDGDEFDKERALETIRKQRESEKALAKELKDAQARLKQLEEAEKVREETEKSELQKAHDRVKELEDALKEAQETTQALRLRQAFSVTARKLELKFANVQAEEDAFLLAEMDGVEIDAEGKVTGLEDAVKELQKSRPYLFAPSDEGGDGQGTPKRGKNGLQGKLNQEAIKAPLVRF